MKAKIFVAAAALVVSGASSAAGVSSEGFYAFGNFGATTTKDESVGISHAYTSTGSSAGNAWNLGVGYDFNKNAAVEVSYGSVWKSEQENTYVDSWGVSRSVSKANVMGLNVSLLGKLPLSENVKVFAGPTVTWLDAKFSSSSTYNGNGGYSNGEESSDTLKKVMKGLTLGLTFALDERTDLRVSAVQYNKIDVSNASETSNTKLKQFMFGLNMKF